MNYNDNEWEQSFNKIKLSCFWQYLLCANMLQNSNLCLSNFVHAHNYKQKICSRFVEHHNSLYNSNNSNIN